MPRSSLRIIFSWSAVSCKSGPSDAVALVVLRRGVEEDEVFVVRRGVEEDVAFEVLRVVEEDVTLSAIISALNV